MTVDGTVEMTEAEAAPLLGVGWPRVATFALNAALCFFRVRLMSCSCATRAV